MKQQEYRSLPLAEWPRADRDAWNTACRSSCGLELGGAASHLSEVSRETYINRYGAFLGFLQRAKKLRSDASAGSQVTLEHVAAYVTELKSHVGSVTLFNNISLLRRAARLLCPDADYRWLYAIEKRLKLAQEPRDKWHRTVMTERLIEAGLTLMIEAKQPARSPFALARGVRNGLMIVLLAVCPFRLRNFATLELAKSFRQFDGEWWIVLPRRSTKSKRAVDRKVPAFLKPYIDFYLEKCRPLLMDRESHGALWPSVTTGRPMGWKAVGCLISKLTLQTLGVDVSPHLFRDAVATTAAAYFGELPHLGSAMLDHRDSHTREEHYVRVTTLRHAQAYADMLTSLLDKTKSDRQSA